MLRKILLVLLFWIAIPILIAEGVLRILLFSGLPVGEPFRKPALYASYDEDDYWKLRELFAPRGPLPNGHPILGWFSKGDLDSLLHGAASRVEGRRPVLLYGDSFAACYLLDECLEDRLNNDEAFRQRCYLLNYAVSGHGLDQIYTLMERTVDFHSDPIVLFGVTTIDLPRSLLSFRDRPKPTYAISDGQLELLGTPLDLDVEQFIADHPVSISSYLYRLALYSRGVPADWRRTLSGEPARVRRERDLSRALLRAAIDSLRKREIEFVFLVFAGKKEIGRSSTEHSARVRLILDVLKSEDVPYISMPDRILEVTAGLNGVVSDYFLTNNAHPNEKHLELVTSALREHLAACNSSQVR